MKERQVWVWLVIAFLSSGCVSQRGQMARDASFSESSETGLVMFGVDVKGQYKSPSLSFLRFDPKTGKVDLSGRVTVEPRIDNLTAGQKFGAAITGQDSRPGGHDYFVVNFPPGEWILYSISGFYSDGSTSYSSVSNFSEGTMALSVRAGEASYVGEFVIAGAYGREITLGSATPDFPAAQAEIASFVNVKRPLVEGVSQTKRYTCADKPSIVGKLRCVPASVVVVID